MVVQNMSGIRKMTVIAIEGVVELHHPFVQGAGHHNNFERRARFHEVADGPIAARVGR